MAENVKKVLNDEALEQASGGTSYELPDPKYAIGDVVILKFSNEQDVVTEVPATVIERRSNPVCWEYKLEYTISGRTYKHWYPEFAL